MVDDGYPNNYTSGTWFNMNNTFTNTGGWEASLMRKNIMPLIKDAFPADLQAVIKPSIIFTTQGAGDGACTATTDDVFLLAEYEIFGTHKWASTQESTYLKQYAYYSAGNSKVKYKHNATSSAANWWERSSRSDSVNPTSFCLVFSGGTSSYISANLSNGVSPCFKV